MPNAARKSITPRPRRETATKRTAKPRAATPASLLATVNILDGAAPLPCVAALARHHRELMSIQHTRDLACIATRKDTPAYKAAHIAFDLVESKGMALRDLILNCPAATLGDATALAVHGFLEAEGIDSPLLQRVFAGIATVLAGAAGVSLDTFGCLGSTDSILRHAGAEVAQ